MTASDPAKALAALLKRLEETLKPCAGACPDPAFIDPMEPMLAEFLRSFLIWDAGSDAAHAALKRIAGHIVDFNELRVCLPDEIVAMLGPEYPRVHERALRLRAALTELFVREHAVTLQPLAAMSKRDAKAYLDSLEGVPHFVSSRVCLLCLGVHAAPVDDRIVHRLVEASILPADATPETGAAALERKIRAGDMLHAYTMLQLWADGLGELPAASMSPASRPPARSSSRAVAPAASDPAAKPTNSRKPAAARAPINGVAEKSTPAGTPKPRKPRKH